MALQRETHCQQAVGMALRSFPVHGEKSFQVLLSSEDYTVMPRNLYVFRISSAPHTRAGAADIDGDGHLDLVLPNSDSTREPTIVVVPGRGDGTFGTRNADGGTCGQYGGAAFGDLNEDGIDDMVTFRLYLSDQIRRSGPCILLGTGNTEEPFFETSTSCTTSPSSCADRRRRHVAARPRTPMR